ncbi:MAG: hypothetical protein K2K14_05585 [Ruminococcus sp.]|nr:hypothetical protein [Ruminococcus sp.]
MFDILSLFKVIMTFIAALTSSKMSISASTAILYRYSSGMVMSSIVPKLHADSVLSAIFTDIKPFSSALPIASKIPSITLHLNFRTSEQN